MAEATEHADLYHRHGSEPGEWDEQESVTGRPNDTPLRGEDKPAVPNSTFGDRAKAAKRADAKAVAADEAEDKAVKPSRARKKDA